MAKASKPIIKPTTTPAVRPINLKEIAKSEWKKCLESPEYFILTYVFIQMSNEGRGKFQLYPFQKKLLHLIHTRDRIIILKSRQLGITTLCAAYALWMFIFKGDSSILCMAPTTNVAKAIIDKFKFAHGQLPKWMLELANANTDEANQKRVVGKNGSKIEALSGSRDAARSKTATFLIFDEFAFVEDAEGTYAAAQQTLATGGKCIVLSCVVKDTFIYTDNGVRKMKDFIKDENGLIDYEVPEYNILGRDSIRSGKLIHNNGEVQTKIINTPYSFIEGSYNHKLYAFSKGAYGWFRLDELSVGDHIAIQYGMNIWGNYNDTSDFIPSVSPKIKNVFKPNLIDEKLAYFIGLYIAEGSSYSNLNKNGDIVGGNLTITCGDDISKAIIDIGLTYSKTDAVHYTVSSKNLIEYFKYLGFNLKNHANKKVIPTKIMSLSRENTIQLLRGIFDGDGSVMYKISNKGKKNLRVYFCSSSKELTLQIRILLLNLGILSTYQESLTKPTKKVKVSSLGHRLDMTNDYAKRFCTIVGFNLPRKVKIYEGYDHDFKRVPTSSDIIPGSVEFIKTLYSLDKHARTFTFTRKYLSRYKMLYFKEFFKGRLTESQQKFFDDNVSENILWAPIKSIQESTNLTYDFSLPNNEKDEWAHSVVYNSIIGHQTPDGSENKFAELYTEAELDNNEFLPVKLDWKVHPDRDQAWRDRQDQELGKRLALQECNAEMLNSGNTYFEPDDLDWIKDNLEDPIQMTGRENEFWVWKFPEEVGNCAVIVDTSRGDGLDYSTVQVIDLMTGDQIAEYRALVGPKEIAKFAVSTCIQYNNALLIVENSGIGNTTCSYVTDSGYSNVYKSLKGDTTNVSQYLNRYVDEYKMTPGFTTSTSTRVPMLQSLKIAIEEKSIRVRSKRLYSEMRSFIWKGPKPTAKSGANDDLLIPLAIGTYLRGTALAHASNSTDMQRACLGGIRMTTPQLSYSNRPNNKNPYMMSNPITGEMEDYSWVLS